MKHFLLIIFAFAISFASPVYAQEPEPGMQAQEKYYMEIKGNVNTLLGYSIKTSLIMGKIIPARTGLSQDEQKRISKMMVFDSMTDAMNFLSAKGWTLENTYSIVTSNYSEIYWVVSKTVSDPMELLDGFFDR